jgi:hypothetical protein
MPHSAPLPLSPEDKLDVLRYLDEFRFWNSLDDERICQRCQQRISARQILVFGRHGTRGNFRLQCPTPGCPSTPSEWVYANPILFASHRNRTARSTPPVYHEARRANAVSGPRNTNRRPEKTRRLPARSFRAMLAKLPVLRSLATGLHAIHPVA